MRPDVPNIVRSIKNGSGMPYTILVSNWSQMTLERYVELCEAGVDQFSVSLDFPDERHDDFRGHAGLYEHLSRVVPEARQTPKRRGCPDCSLAWCDKLRQNSPCPLVSSHCPPSNL